MKKWTFTYMPPLFEDANGTAMVSYGEINESSDKLLLDILTIDQLKETSNIMNQLEDSRIRGFYAGYFNKAVCYDLGIGVEQSLDNSKKYYQLAFLQKKLDNEEYELNKQSMTVINLLDAPEVYSDGVINEYPMAAYLYAQCFYEGRGVEENDSTANSFFLMALEKGCVKAAERLGNSFYFGYGVDKNIMLALKFYDTAFEGGCVESGVNSAIINLELGNQSESLRIISKLAELNHPKTQGLIDMYLKRF